MKTGLKVFGGLFALVLVAIIAIPFFVNVDKFRPEIVKAANESLNGRLELGKLGLSLWGRVRVTVDGIQLKDQNSQTVLSVKDSSFDIPFMSVLSGSPLITLSMQEPQITVIKHRDGKLNVMSLMKETSPASAKPALKPGQVVLPAIAVNSHLGVSIVNAKVIYKDDTLALSNTIDNLNLRIKDFSLSRATDLELWADLKTQMGKDKASDTSVEGPLKLIATLTPDVSGGEFKSASLNATFTADDLAIRQGDLFHKQKGVPFHFKFNGSLTQDSLNLKEAALRFHNAEIVVAGNFHKDTGANFTFNAKPIDLKSWSELVPMLAAYELEGKLGLDGEFKGKPEALQYKAKLTIQNLAAKGPMLKAKPVINGDITVVTDQIQHIGIDLKGPGNELMLEGKLVSFKTPQITFTLHSPGGLDLDQWIEFPKTPAKGSESAASTATGTSATGGNSASSSAAASKNTAVDYDAMLDPLRTNPMLKGTVIDGSVAIAFIKAMGIRIDDIGAKIQMKNLVAALNAIKLKLYDGLITGAFTVDLKPKQPQYTMQLNVTGFDVQKAVESQFQSFKNTLVGTLSTSINGGGTSFNVAEIKKKLQIKGDFKMANATFKTIDVAKMASDAVNKSLSKIGDKVPALQGKTLNVPGDTESRYDLVSSNFTMSGGTLDAPNFLAKAAVKKGIDIKGSTKMGLIDESLDAHWELIDSQKLLPPVSVNIAGQNVNNILAKGDNDPVILPITVGCKWSAPCTNYSEVPAYLASVAAGRISKVAGDVAKAKVQEAVQKAIQDKAPAAIQNGLKGLFGH